LLIYKYFEISLGILQLDR